MKQFKYCSNQDGAALVVGLILLVVVTILAVSGMNTATTELAMARNDQNHENAFQAAETGIEAAMANRPYSTVGTITLNPYVSANESVSLTIQYEDSTLVPDRAFSLGVGSGISAYHFLATATADSKRAGTAGSATDRDASATHTQAFYTIGPEDSAL
ncbi:MAG: PilX N-terminal domain-containing pilus assembly protein [Woeseiales bacterium]|mgnify:CR=1 FL=1|jgi:type IV pilus assembly protein PilX